MKQVDKARSACADGCPHEQSGENKHMKLGVKVGRMHYKPNEERCSESEPLLTF